MTDISSFASPAAPLYYKHSGRFQPVQTAVAVLIAALLGLVLAVPFAYLEVYVPLVKLEFLMIGGYGFLLGFILWKQIEKFKVRNVGVAETPAAEAGSEVKDAG